MVASSRETLVILAATDRYEVGEVEERIFRSAKSPRPYELIHYPLDISLPLASIPDELAANVHGLFLLRHYLTASDIDRFPKLRCVVRTGVGYDRVDRKALAAAGITLSNVPDYGTTEVADHAVTLALSLRRGLLLQHDHQRTCYGETSWDPLDGPPLAPSDQQMRGHLIQRPRGKIWGSIGFGRIGIAAALRAKAFGWKVIFYDPYLANGIDKALDVTRVREIPDIFRLSDVISLHCPNNSATHHIVNDTTLSLVKPGAILVNVARGELVDLDALERALRSGVLSGAGLDVLETEPVQEPVPSLVKAYRNRENWLMGRLVITPHVAFYSTEAVADMRLKSAETMRDVLFDGMRSNVIEPDSC